jgi:sulfur-oxidizing protein SoxA
MTSRLAMPKRAGGVMARGAAVILATALACVPARSADGDTRPIAPERLRSGASFNSPDLQAQQADDFANPGMLWVDQGAVLWSQPPAPGAPSCASCHGEAAGSMRGVAARLPKAEPASGRLVNLQGAINDCRTRRQGQPALGYESQPLLSLAAFVGYQSRGLPLAVEVSGAAAPWFERGQALYRQRLGQMNLACTHCHDRHWGRRLLAEPISQGHGNAYPIYRIEWQGMGTLHRRFRACLFGVRAEMLPQGADDYLALELYLAWRGQGMAVETPGIRR